MDKAGAAPEYRDRVEEALGVDDWKVTALEVGLFWLVGVSGILLGSAHLFTPAPVAKAIGWPTSRFQWEVGLAGVGYGVAGVMAPALDRGFWPSPGGYVERDPPK